MNRYFLEIEVQDGEIEAILAQMDEARATIGECCNKLRDLGVLTIRKEEAAAGHSRENADGTMTAW